MDRRHHGEGSDRLLTPDDLAERLGVPAHTLAQWRSRGQGPRYLEIGRHRRYRLADVVEWENSRYPEEVAAR
jgi:hypothetical protein